MTRRYRYYPWDYWFDGRVRLLAPGEHYEVPTGQFAHQIRMAARKRGLPVMIRRIEDGLVIRMPARSLFARQGS